MHSVWSDYSLIFISVFLYLLERLITATSYKAELDDEISFEAGVLVTVLEKNFDGWWLIRWVFWPVLLTSPYNTFFDEETEYFLVNYSNLLTERDNFGVKDCISTMQLKYIMVTTVHDYNSGWKKPSWQSFYLFIFFLSFYLYLYILYNT